MADPEKLTALKKAYADAILNTSKEAAARVVVSERKARGYQQELVAVRDEALRTLLRLKEMLDSKVREVEVISLTQKSKILELEAQLGEAEDIVGELRMELRELQDELGKVVNGQTHADNKENPCWENGEADGLLRKDYSNHERSETKSSCTSAGQSGLVVAKEIRKPSLNGIMNIRRCSYRDNEDGCCHALPSILTKHREVEGLKEGCNQVIHTMERNGHQSANALSCKSSTKQSVETLLQTSDCTNISDSPSLYSDIRDGGDTRVSHSPASLRAQGSDRKALMGISDEESPVSPSDTRFIKYTFKRKRKKDALNSPNGDSFVDESGSNKNQKTDNDLNPSSIA